MTKKIKLIIAFLGILVVIAGIFWFSTRTQDITQKQTTQSRATDTTSSFLCSWTTNDTSKHKFEVAIVDLAGNIVAKDDVATDASSPTDKSEYKFTNIPNEKLIGVKCQIRIIDHFCNEVSLSEPDICTNFEKTTTETVTTTMTPTETPTETPTGTLTATPTGTLTQTPTATPTVTATPGAGTATATPGSTSTGGGTATSVPTAVSTAAAATATQAAASTATHAPTATAAAAATATRAAAATSTSAASTATAAATNGVTVAATNTTTQSSASLPTAGTIHPAIILGIISLFIIALGLVF